MKRLQLVTHTQSRLLRSLLALLAVIAVPGLLFALPAAANPAAKSADSGVAALVNGEPVSAYDLQQRQRFMAATGDLKDDMQRAFKGIDIQEKWKEFVRSQPRPPQSQAEADALKEKFRVKLDSIKQDVQARVVSARMSTVRKAALEELVEERLMIQEAKKENIVISDDDVRQQLTRKSDDGKVTQGADELFEKLRGMKIDPKTYVEKMRARAAWAQFIRRKYIHLINTSVGTQDSAAQDETPSTNMLYDVRVLRVALPANAEQRVVAKTVNDAYALQQRFTSCDALPAQAKLLNGATVVPMNKVPASKFEPDARAVITKSAAGQMTPPVVVRNSVESYAVCRKHAAETKAKEKGAEKPDERQQQFQIYSKRHLKDLKQAAYIEYR